MGQVALAAKITHVPSMYLSELPGPRHGSRQDAIDGHLEISRRCRALGVDTLVVFDTHWLVNANYHLNCAPHFKGTYTSNELPHFISNLPFEARGNPALGQLLAREANAMGVETLAHDATTLNPEYGTLVPLRYMNADQHFKVVSVSALCMAHYLNDSARLGWAFRRAVEQHYDGTVAFLASGSMSHRFAQNGLAPEFAFKLWSPFLEQLDRHVLAMWARAEWADFCAMLPEYAAKGHGEGFMHDTAMLLGSLGWSAYDGQAELVTPYFGASGTGQVNAILPVTPQDGRSIPAAQASSATGYTAVATGCEPHLLIVLAMPHLVLLYTPNLDAPLSEGGCDMTALCRALADTMLAQRFTEPSGADKPVFPPGGVRVLAYPARHFAVADGGAAGRAAGQGADYAFVYLNLRMARGRSPAVHQAVGRAVEATAKAHLAQQLASRPIGVTLQIDEGPEVFDAKNSSLHPLF